ncbi:MAG: DUF2877 domain-containing protein [Actinomycetota bacterium]
MRRAPGALAASDAIADVLTGPLRPAVVIHRSGPAAYLRLDSGRIVALETGAGVELPISATVEHLDGVEVGTELHLGAGRPARWWSSEAPSCAPDERLARRLGGRLDRLDPPTDPHERALVGRSPLDGPAALVGLGPGLTPAGDDLVAGALVACRATGRHVDAERIADGIDPERTTPISGALLTEAGRGRAARPLLALLDALGGRGDLDAALDRVLAVGATSGRWLAEGVRRVLDPF